jgi:hypothetical protein
MSPHKTIMVYPKMGKRDVKNHLNSFIMLTAWTFKYEIQSSDFNPTKTFSRFTIVRNEEKIFELDCQIGFVTSCSYFIFVLKFGNVTN